MTTQYRAELFVADRDYWLWTGEICSSKELAEIELEKGIEINKGGFSGKPFFNVTAGRIVKRTIPDWEVVTEEVVNNG